MIDRRLFAAALACAALSSAPALADPAFDATLKAHFAAVQTRDLPALEKTLTAGEALTLILPNGKRTTTRAEFVAFHVEWFREKTWSMHFEPVSSIVRGDLATTTVRTRYEDTVDGASYWSESWLTLTFAREPGGWRLVHDQNTRIRTSAD